MKAKAENNMSKFLNPYETAKRAENDSVEDADNCQSNCGSQSKTMSQVMVSVNEVIERSLRGLTGTRIDQEDVAQFSLMLSDIDGYTQRKLGKSFYDLNCEDVDLEFLNSYKDDLFARGGSWGHNPTPENHISSLHFIFILCDAYEIANMDIDMFELFLKQQGLLRA